MTLYAAPWNGTNRTVDIDGPTNYVDFGGPTDSTPVLFVHGLGGSHLNWVLLAQELAADHHVMALDLVGFGLTRSAGRTSSVESNVALVARFLDEVIGQPTILVGNSMGGMISGLVASAYPAYVAGAVLIDPALPLEVKRPDRQVFTQFLLYTLPGVGERYMAKVARTTTPREQVQDTLDICVADQSDIDRDFVEASVALAAERREFPESDHAFLVATRSLMLQNMRSKRYLSRLHAITAPVLLIHGEKDRLVPVSAGRALATAEPSWTYDEIPGVGHTPQVEAPQRVAESITTWMKSTLPKST
ncbi:pimeloyl-ACP methyl ester carboxylesterase [Antricoccus suffuscus]|uniref:Pimeloyl-ACP methyl ester carboxylesterase n=1 Tax=Antricoccus suffuscus TaxID=1629062 RepID=A0A2T0Z8R4_9ACTN|nr:alpha/beta hydrolase [Antricoccus suffuscus]PRZ32730.1 pimeloyl-ACP methyl ester carboxylesterase [Antricoccus suffuscus]